MIFAFLRLLYRFCSFIVMLPSCSLFYIRHTPNLLFLLFLSHLLLLFIGLAANVLKCQSENKILSKMFHVNKAFKNVCYRTRRYWPLTWFAWWHLSAQPLWLRVPFSVSIKWNKDISIYARCSDSIQGAKKGSYTFHSFSLTAMTIEIIHDAHLRRLCIIWLS